jgi:molybdopterin-guanine dinucleotide biosynthesis protein A
MGDRGVASAGFVLVGGRSLRMGRDKALLSLNGSTLIQHIASQVLQSAGSATLVGSPERYEGLGYPAIADRMQGRGPLGGVYTALSVSQMDWNLIVACDMPAVTADFFKDLLSAAEATGADCLVPETAAGLEPLCAVYHRRCRDAAHRALTCNILKMHDFVSTLRAQKWPVPDPSRLLNANTPEEWKSR